MHFESPDSGFFLKHALRQSVSDVSSSQSRGGVKSSQDTVLSVDKFTVVQTTQPVSIRASYGPFSTKQTVPARYIVPDISEATTDSSHPTVTTAQNATQALLELQQQSNLHLDISAHLVRNTIPRDSPVLRVLFHAGADPGGHLQRQKICVLLHVSMTKQVPLKGRCIPEGEDGVCVAEVVIPSNWWPAMPPPEKEGQPAAPQKTPQRYVQVAYSVFEPPAKNPELCEPKVQIQPLTSFAKVKLNENSNFLMENKQKYSFSHLDSACTINDSLQGTARRRLTDDANTPTATIPALENSRARFPATTTGAECCRVHCEVSARGRRKFN